jgi:hypothetical protein
MRFHRTAPEPAPEHRELLLGRIGRSLGCSTHVFEKPFAALILGRIQARAPGAQGTALLEPLAQLGPLTRGHLLKARATGSALLGCDLLNPLRQAICERTLSCLTCQ